MKDSYLFKFKDAKTRHDDDVFCLTYKPLNVSGDPVTFPLSGSVFKKGKRPIYKMWSLSGGCGQLKNMREIGFYRENLEIFDLSGETLKSVIQELLDNKFDIHPNHFKLWGLDLSEIIKQ